MKLTPMRPRLIPLILVQSAALCMAQAPAAPEKAALSTPAATFTVPATLPQFFGVVTPAKTVKPADFEGIIPGELFLLQVGMKDAEIKAARQATGKTIYEIKLPEGCFYSKLRIGQEMIGNEGANTELRASYFSFDSYGGKPPTREAVKKMAGLFYKTLGHPTKFRQSASRHSLVIEWESATHTVELTFQKPADQEPRSILLIKNKKLCTSTWQQPADTVETKPPLGPLGFRSFFEKWHATFLTQAEENWALDRYVRSETLRKEREAKEAAALQTTRRELGGGASETSATVKVELKRPKPAKDEAVEKPGEEMDGTGTKPVEEKP